MRRMIEAGIMIAVCALVLLWAGKAWSADPIQEDRAVRALIGEASGEGLRGMQAVGEVIRRRGGLRGIYGVNATHVDKEPAWVWKMARKAWRDSASSNLTKGATHFESTDFKTPYWAKEKEVAIVIGKHIFYK